MVPDSTQHRPAVSTDSLPAATESQLPPDSSAVANGDATLRAVVQARQLKVQYGNEPYKMSEAFGQLKTAYLADQYHITANSVDD